jgi:ribosome maturation factor RimP
VACGNFLCRCFGETGIPSVIACFEPNATLNVTTDQPLKERALNRITELATGVAQSLGLSVLDVRLSQQGGRMSLEVCIFRKQGETIGLSDCEQVSRALDRVLDEETQISGPVFRGTYFLEVVSPGIDRQLTTAREFELFSGQQIRVRARENISDLGSEFVCQLLGGDDSQLDLAGARALLSSDGKVSKGKGAKNKAGHRLPKQSEVLGYSSGAAFKLELAKVFKVNLYSEGVKKETNTAVH